MLTHARLATGCRSGLVLRLFLCSEKPVGRKCRALERSQTSRIFVGVWEVPVTLTLARHCCSVCDGAALALGTWGAHSPQDCCRLPRARCGRLGYLLCLQTWAARAHKAKMRLLCYYPFVYMSWELFSIKTVKLSVVVVSSFEWG